MSHVVPVLFVGGAADGNRQFLQKQHLKHGHRVVQQCPSRAWPDFDIPLYATHAHAYTDYRLADVIGDTHIMTPGGNRRDYMLRLVAGYTKEALH